MVPYYRETSLEEIGSWVQPKDDLPKMIMLLDNNSILFANPTDKTNLLKVSIQNDLLENETDNSPVNSIACINGVVYWYVKENDALCGVQFPSGSSVRIY
jgi:hypothetical protein